MGVEKESPMIFISSDKRDLYFEDIFRVMAAPYSYSIKFRYQNKWIESDRKINIGTEIIICSLLGTNNEIRGSCKELIPIRRAEVQAIETGGNRESDLTMYYLKLKDFVKLINKKEKIDLNSIPKKVVFDANNDIEGTQIKVEPCSWDEKVDEIFSLKNNGFRNRLLYQVEKLEQKICRKFWIKVNLKNKNTYVLHSNSQYKLTINLRKSGDKKTILNIDTDEKSFKNILKYFSLDAPRDKVRNDFYTSTLDKDNRYSRIIFSNPPHENKDSKGNKHDFKIDIKFKRKKKTYLFFGILMGALTTITKYNGIISFSKIFDIWNDKGYLGILNYSLFPLLVGLISGLLFYGYDKK